MSVHVLNPGGASGGGSVGQLSTIVTRAQALLGSTLDTPLGSDFDNDQWPVIATGGTGSTNMNTTARGGVITMTSGATAGGTAQMKPHGGTASHVSNPAGTRWYYMARAAVTTAIDAQTTANFGILNNGGNPNALIGVFGSVSTVNFTGHVVTNGGVTTNVTTVGVAIDTNYHTFEIWCDTVNVTFAVDGTQLGSTPVANIGTNSAFIGPFVGNGATAATRSIDIDRTYVVVASN